MRIPSSSALIALLCFAAPVPSRAAVWYIARFSPGPEHDGKTWQTAMTTIPPAIAAAASGDEIWVGYGTYTDNITLKRGVSVYGGFVGYELFRDQRVGVQGITTITGAGSAFNVTAGSGITTATVFDGFTITNGHGIQCLGGSPTISHNVLTDNSVYSDGAINVSGGAPYIIDNVIANNTGAGKSAPAGIHFDGAPVIANNTIVGNSGCGISGSGFAIIFNNIVAYNIYGISARQTGDYPKVSHNCVYGNLVLGYLQMARPDYTGADGNISVDPGFAVYAYGNLHLAPDSPCIDAGADQTTAPGTDIDFQPRKQGAGTDIGADESDGHAWTFTPRIVRVSPTGNDANDGSTWALAKKTIQAGIDLASSQGGDVWVERGTYLIVPPSGSAYGVTLKPNCYVYGGFAGTETALAQRDWIANTTFLIRQSGGVAMSAAGYRVSGIDGFVFQSASTAPAASVSGIMCGGGSPFIRNNVFLRLQGTPISAVSASPLIANNAFVSNNPGSAYGIVVCSYAPAVIAGNVFSANGPFGSNSSASTLTLNGTGRATVTNNLFVNNYVSSTGTGYTSCIIGTGDNQIVIANNTFAGNRGSALYISTKATIANNVFAQNDGCIRQEQAVSQVSTNCYYGSFYPVYDIAVGSAGNISDYPRFTDLLDGDYRLSPSSPCVDAGNDSFVSSGDRDLDGNPRIQGRHVDMGCFESSATSMVVRWGDVARALRIAGGLLPATADDVSLLETQQATSPGIDILDAQQIIRQLSVATR